MGLPLMDPCMENVLVYCNKPESTVIPHTCVLMYGINQKKEQHKSMSSYISED